jgi:hypothetical protein
MTTENPEAPDMTQTIFTTVFGNATLPDLLKAYEQKQRNLEAKKAFMQTEEGKEYNKRKAKEFYLRHKAEVLAKRKERYEKDAAILNERNKAYYYANREQLLLKRKEKKGLVEA